jgi:hypothetical protein
MKKEMILNDYKLNFKKLERVVKELNTIKSDYQRREEQSELFYKLQDKKITIDEYKTESAILEDKQEQEREQRELLTIEEKLLQDNENILIDKLIMLIYQNIIFKYNNIGEKTTEKIDGEIKEYLKDIFNDKYFNIVQFNEWQNYQPNQFVALWKNSENWSNDYYDKKLVFYLKSKLGHRNDYQQDLFIKNNVIKLNQYSKTLEEIKADNLANQNRIEKTEIVRDTKRKAKEIYKAYKKKVKTTKELEEKIKQEKSKFDDTIKTNQDTFFHNLYSYFYR